MSADLVDLSGRPLTTNPSILVAQFSYAGVDPRAENALIQEMMLAAMESISIGFMPIFDDALIDRSRNLAASRFLKNTEFDVLFMVDRDIVWSEGDLIATAKKAHQENAVVGGIYKTRGMNSGIAGRLIEDGVAIALGEDRLYPAEFLGTGFIAFPRKVLQAVVGRNENTNRPYRLTSCMALGYERTKETFWDFFRPFCIRSRTFPAQNEYLSEDWAACERISHAGFSLFLYAKPLLTHYGEYGYTLRDLRTAKR